jgi:hypothetical protein
MSPVPANGAPLSVLIRAGITLVPEVGPEVVLIVKENVRFVDQIRTQGPLRLMLKGGAVRTSAGPVLFMIWCFPPLINNSPFAAYELLTSPESSPNGRELLAAACRQTHLHLVILDENEEILDVVEFENKYGLDRLVIIGAEIAKDLVEYDFARAGAAFFSRVLARSGLGGRTKFMNLDAVIWRTKVGPALSCSQGELRAARV